MTPMEAPQDLFTVDLPPAPYPGLRPFEKREWPVFFGRETMTVEVTNRLMDRHWIMVHGDSGCGKSSLIRAGVQAQLEQEQARTGRQWITVDMRPGDAPMRAMAKALARDDRPESVIALRRALNRGRDGAGQLSLELALKDDQRLCLLVDQFEELFRFARESDGHEARLFTEVLVGLEANPPPSLYVVLTMRSEFLGHCARYDGLAEAVNRGQYLLPRMDRAGLVRAIREPAKLYGCEIDADLTDALIADAGGGQDQLPLIQHGLMRLWVDTAPDHVTFGVTRTPHRIGLSDYPGAQGLAGLLSDHANKIMDAVAPPADFKRRHWVEHLFRALTDINAEGHAVRRPQTFRQLVETTGAEPDALAEIINGFRAEGISFLTPYGDAPISNEDRIDVGHEALIRCWHRIADPDPRVGWLKREFKDGRTWQTLRVLADGYQEDHTKVLPPATTREWAKWFEALPSPAWSARYGGGYPAVQQLLDASETAAEKSRRMERKLRLMKLGIAIGAVFLVCGAMVIYAAYELFGARDALKRQEEETQIQSQRLAQSETELRLQTQATATATSPDASLIASVDSSGNLYLRNINTGMRVDLASTCDQARPDAVVFSPTGKEIAIASGNDTYILDVASRNCRFLGGYGARVRRIAFTPDGRLFATGTDVDRAVGEDGETTRRGTCRIWDVKSGELVQALDCPFTVIDISFDATGKRLISKGSDGGTLEWSSRSGDFRDAEKTPTAAAELPPRLYMHIQSEDSRVAAAAWQSLLEQTGLIVPGIEMVGKKSPSNSQLRYFRKAEQDRAQLIIDQMRRSGAEIGLTYVPGHEDSNKIRPLHFELWLADNSIGYWFPVVASIADRDKAIAEANRISQVPTSRRYDVQLYQATDAKGKPVYAVTLGGYLNEAEAGARVMEAKKEIEPTAYAWQSRIWRRERF